MNSLNFSLENIYENIACEEWTFLWDRPSTPYSEQQRHMRKVYEILRWIWQERMEDYPKRNNISLGVPFPPGTKPGVRYEDNCVFLIQPGIVILFSALPFFNANHFEVYISLPKRVCYLHHQETESDL